MRLSDGDSLQITAYGIEYLADSPTVIYVHGFKGFKDWGWGPSIGEFFSGKGYTLIAFNFSHNGIGDNPLEFTEPDKFAANTFSREVRELSELIDNWRDGYFGVSPEKKLGLIGHSRGGAIALLAAARKKEVNAVTTWSSVCRLNRYSEEIKRKWRQQGHLEVINQRTKQVMHLGSELLKDIETNAGDLLSVEKAVKSLQRPLAIFHGENDENVDLAEGDQLLAWSNKRLTRLYHVSNAGHTFNMAHPFTGSNPQFDEVLDNTFAFFKANLY